ncbi:MAG TPA: hypothetical protein VJ001_02515 [Rhodocyclaceae bacterium]|nr:hypothetical protein [Rhodocyclaceae bacterium]
MSKMTPAKARELRDGGARHRPSPFSRQSGTRKHRELRFATQPPHQVDQARKLLAGLEGLEVDDGLAPRSLSIWYEIGDYTLQGLEAALRQQGFKLDNGVFCRLARVIVYYCEETQLRNMRVPERLIKKSHEVYSKAWEHHPHGDHDDTPPELRQDR